MHKLLKAFFLFCFLVFTFFSLSLKAEVTRYSSWEIPEFVKPEPNFETLKFYLNRQLTDKNIYNKWIILPSNEAKKFEKEIKINSFLNNEMKKSSIVSYLFFDNDKIIYDKKSPKDRFGNIVDDKTKLLSNSMGKSLVSYITGHAICKGFIKGIETKVDDWPLIKNTLYHNQTLINLLNMRARDNNYVDDMKGMLPTGRWYNVHSIKSFVERELKGSKPSPKWSDKYRYNGFVTNIIMNYVIYKSGSNFQNILNEIFQKKAGIKYSAFFLKNKWQRYDNGGINEILPQLNDDDGNSWYQFYASRYDYLRIANAILNDWKNDTCVGKYLKNIYENRKSKTNTNHPRLKHSNTYGGQFHTDFTGMIGRNIMAMEGYGGQSVMIDFDNSRILVLNTIHTNYNFDELVIKAIKNGKLKE